jgi:hypothetical protein
LKYFGVRGFPELVNIAFYIKTLRKYNPQVANIFINLIVRGPEIKSEIQELLKQQNKKFSVLNRIKTRKSQTNTERKQRYTETLELFVKKYMQPIHSHPTLHGKTIQDINTSAVNYVDGLIGNFRFVVNNYYKEKKKYDNKRSNSETLGSMIWLYNNYEVSYFTKLNEQLGTHPCVDNALEEMSSMTVGETFTWNGKNASKHIIKNVKNYEFLLNKHMQRLMNSFNSNNKNRFQKANMNAQATMLWNKLKGKQVSVLYNNHVNGPLPFIPLSQYNRNGSMFKKYFKKTVYLENN